MCLITYSNIQRNKIVMMVFSNAATFASSANDTAYIECDAESICCKMKLLKVVT